MKLAANKPVETAKKITVASAFSNNSDDDDDDDEPPPMKYSRNIGRLVPEFNRFVYYIRAKPAINLTDHPIFITQRYADVERTEFIR